MDPRAFLAPSTGCEHKDFALQESVLPWAGGGAVSGYQFGSGHEQFNWTRKVLLLFVLYFSFEIFAQDKYSTVVMNSDPYWAF